MSLYDAVELGFHLLEIHQDDLRALTRKGVGNGLADAPGAADDDCNFDLPISYRFLLKG